MLTHHMPCAVLLCLILLAFSAGAAVPKDSAAGEIAHWAELPADGPEGRPLPLAGSWMADKMYGPDRFVELIDGGHHMLITFLDPSFVAARRDEKSQADRIDSYYRAPLEYARQHNLPIAIRGWNWSDSVIKYQDLRQKKGEEIPLDEQARMVIDGKPGRRVDPFGPVKAWQEWGEFWFGNGMMQQIQEIYPDPPMVLFLNNNEGPKVRNPNQIPDGYERMVAQFGEGPDKTRAIREGYRTRYAAMFAAAREAMVKPAWKKNVKFVAYNALWGTGYIGHGNRPQRGIWFEPDEGWLEWRMNDGAMPELYDNDWQPGKSDHTPNGPQVEAMSYYSVQDRLFERDPDLYWASIVWEGARMGNVWRGRRSTSKPYRYATRGQRWDFRRYEGWMQFCLWATRARSFREFRWPPSDRHAYDEGIWNTLIDVVDRPWKNKTLREFWRFGELVPNPDQKHPFPISEDQPEWIKELDRWYLLTCDANPPRKEWNHHTKLNVFALAMELGDEPNRRWLLYAHAPLGAVPDAAVTLPGFGQVALESVPKSGSFFLVRENDESVRPLITGGPEELGLQADRRRARPGEKVTFRAAVAHAPDRNFTGFTWSFGDGETAEQDRLAKIEHGFPELGEYVVTLEGRLENGEALTEQTVVFVGEPPDEAIVYDLSLDDPLAWEGPWDDSGTPDHTLVTYRHLPNRGRAPRAVLTGGRFVKDPERGNVVELAGGHDAIWLIRNADTVMNREGHPDQTISLWFKADSTEGRQVLYAQSFHGAGFNIYLDGETLYAGSWAPAAGMDATGWYPVWGRDWDGDWLSAQVSAGKWHHVALVLKDATGEVEENKQHLYLDGKRIESGPGVRIPRQYAVPRVGRTKIDGKLLTRFHDDAKDARPFEGRIDEFRLIHAAVHPEE